jgi:hypothetical protein
LPDARLDPTELVFVTVSQKRTPWPGSKKNTRELLCNFLMLLVITYSCLPGLGLVSGLDLSLSPTSHLLSVFPLHFPSVQSQRSMVRQSSVQYTPRILFGNSGYDQIKLVESTVVISCTVLVHKECSGIRQRVKQFHVISKLKKKNIKITIHSLIYFLYCLIIDSTYLDLRLLTDSI